MTMNHSQFFIDQNPSESTACKVPAFPWVRADAQRFVWEEALYQGNYLTVHHSAMGRSQSKENIFQKLTRGRFAVEHLHAFELEVDGELLRDNFQWQPHEVRRTPEGFEELIVTLTNARPSLTVKIHTLLDGTSFLVRWLEIENRGPAPCNLSRVYPWAGLIANDEEGISIVKHDAGGPFVLGFYRHGRWCMEGDFEWMPLADGSFSAPRPSNDNKFNPPFFAVQNRRTGELTLLHVESTPHSDVVFTQAIERTHDLIGRPWLGRYLHAKAGLGGPAPLRVLAPGETVTSPKVHLSMIHGDLDAGVNALYDHLRTSVIPRLPDDCADLVEYNHTGYTLNAQVSRELLRQEVEVAAEIGVELFLVDAGWFGPKDKSWHEVIGDWTENPILGAGGLKEVFAYARGKGMKCGLWMPPELARPETPVARAHPDWFLRGGASFDLLNPVVEEYVYATICQAVEEFALDCFRIDIGATDLGERVTSDGRREAISWRYFDKLHSIYARVRERFPRLILENCCAGGGRTDLAMLRNFPYTQITDNWDPADQIRILNGTTLALTPSQCMPLVGSINMHVADIDFVIRTGMLGHFTASGVFPNLNRINPPTLARWKHGIDLYKRVIRPLLPTCRVYHHTPIQAYTSPGDWVVLEYTGAAADRAVVGLFRLTGSANDTYTFIAHGLDAAREYLVTFDNTGRAVQFSGRQLTTTGLAVRLPAVLQSELLIIQPV